MRLDVSPRGSFALFPGPAATSPPLATAAILSTRLTLSGFTATAAILSARHSLSGFAAAAALAVRLSTGRGTGGGRHLGPGDLAGDDGFLHLRRRRRGRQFLWRRWRHVHS
jgi:hypothetical protein